MAGDVFKGAADGCGGGEVFDEVVENSFFKFNLVKGGAPFD